MAFTIAREGGVVKVSDRGAPPREYPSAQVHGCDTSISPRGKIHVSGVEATWTDDHGRLHLSDDKRARPSGEEGVFGGLGL